MELRKAGTKHGGRSAVPANVAFAGLDLGRGPALGLCLNGTDQGPALPLHPVIY